MHIAHLDVGAHLGPLLGEALLYRSLWPEMHHRAQILQIGDPAELARHADDLYELPRGHSRPCYLRAAGSIRVTRCVGHRRCIAATVTKWSAKAAPAVSQRAIGEVLAGARSYDSLTDKEQAIVRAEWAERIEARRVGLDLEARFAAEGRPYAVLDEHGEVVVIDGADESAAAS